MTSPTTSTSSTTDSPSSSSSTTDEGSSSDSSSSGEQADSSSSGDLPEEVALGGTVRDFLGVEPLPNVDVSIYDSDLSTVSDADGGFAFGGLEPDLAVAFVLSPLEGGPDDPSYAGAIVPERTGVQDRSDVDATMIQQTLIENQIAGLDETAAEPDLDAAIVIVRSDSETIGAGDVTIEMDPPPAEGTFYAPDETGAAVVNSSTIGYNILPVAVFFNVADTEPGDITVTATHAGGQTCTIAHPQWPTLGGHITIVNVTCE